MARTLRTLLPLAMLLLAVGCADVEPATGADPTLSAAPALDTTEGELTLQLCGGPKGLVCPKSMFCEKHAGTCTDAGAYGVCRPYPTVCARIYKPVCGCDGKTYSNDCLRRSAGVNKAHDGKCEAKCGGIAGLQCPKGQFCLYPAGTCDWADMMGKCVTPPQACPDVWAPVCGCDGQTYGNECEMKAAGASLDHDGACCNTAIKCAAGFLPVDTDGDGCDDACKAPCESACDCYDQGLEFENGCYLKCMNCGNFWTCSDLGFCEEQCGFIPPEAWACQEKYCTDNAECGEKDYCAKDSCDGKGVCKPRPEACITLYDPVCGCDGQTYGNACEAAGAGVNVSYKGTCKPTFCGGIAGFPCPAGMVCDFPAGTCPVADNAGTCVSLPDTCPKIWAPVCDCTGKTWPNDCERLSAGAQKDHDGECKVDPCAPQDAMGEGPCDLFLGWYWNGKECVGVSGCSCVGDDCGAGTMDLEECKKLHAGCGCKPILCSEEQAPADADGDGCDDTCVCAFAIKCMIGYTPTDTNGDGCADTCKKDCHDIVCKWPKVPTDQDGDGCMDTCVCGIAIDCAPGFVPVDSDGDGCEDSCKPLCEPLACSKEQAPADVDGDGCADKCYCMIAIDCAPGYVGADTNGDGCIDSCKPWCSGILCGPGHTPVDTNNDGCPDVCKANL